MKKWENAGSVTFWLNKLQEKKKTDSKSDGKLCSVENHEIDPVAEEKPAESKPYKKIEDIRSQLLGLGDDDYEIDQEIDKENSKPEEESISKKEKMLDKKLKKIDEVFRMVSEIYRNGPTRGLSPIPLREQTPPLRQRSASRSPNGENQLPLPPIHLPLGDIAQTTREPTTGER